MVDEYLLILKLIPWIKPAFLCNIPVKSKPDYWLMKLLLAKNYDIPYCILIGSCVEIEAHSFGSAES